jgi:enterochelin esterase family protein
MGHDPGADPGAQCRAETLVFRHPDPDRRFAAVRLVQHAGLDRDNLEFGYDEVERVWQLTVVRPALWRLEYLLERRTGDGHVEQVCDPDNPRRVPGAFGDKSVLECPEYFAPAWLELPPADGSWRELTIPAPPLRADVAARIWSPATPTDRVLVAHDGPEYERLASSAHYSAALINAGTVPPHHVVLLAPGERNEWYSANPSYAWALAGHILPALSRELGTRRPVVGMGASLGGLAMLHAQRRYPAGFAGLFLQSGSFFQPRYDRMEARFQRYLRIVRFTGRVLRAADGPPVPVVLTCGLVEENLHNNRDMAAVLARQGYPVRLHEVPDAHNYTAWRDAFDPYLTELLRYVWG